MIKLIHNERQYYFVNRGANIGWFDLKTDRQVSMDLQDTLTTIAKQRGIELAPVMPKVSPQKRSSTTKQSQSVKVF